jgi:thiol-disulfide isomerase/thioredoxin
LNISQKNEETEQYKKIKEYENRFSETNSQITRIISVKRDQLYWSNLFSKISNLVFSQNWQTNFDEAKKIAIDQDKNIIIVFSGSDWCAPCIKLDKNIWQSDAFKNQSEILSLPIYPELSDLQQDFVINKIKQFLKLLME